MTPERLTQSERVAAVLHNWFPRHRRRFSFRQRPSGYRILLAELLLRKTRAADADKVFKRLSRSYPTALALSAAHEGAIRRQVAPIGLPNRASTLIAVARALVDRHGGKVPRTRDELLALPGIGPYAAGAVMSIGLGIPAAMVDGSIGRLLRRVGGIGDNGRAPYYDKRVWALAERLLPATGVREHQLALLDVAALHCRPLRPLCSTCPLENICSYAGRT